MRCLHCDVDLSETVVRCPLCGSPAEDVAPNITGIASQDYPPCSPHKKIPPLPKLPKKTSLTWQERIQAIFHP